MLYANQPHSLSVPPRMVQVPNRFVRVVYVPAVQPAAESQAGMGARTRVPHFSVLQEYWDLMSIDNFVFGRTHVTDLAGKSVSTDDSGYCGCILRFLFMVQGFA